MQRKQRRNSPEKTVSSAAFNSRLCINRQCLIDGPGNCPKVFEAYFSSLMRMFLNSAHIGLPA
jgi:hypothetical protein